MSETGVYDNSAFTSQLRHKVMCNYDVVVVFAEDSSLQTASFLLKALI